MNTQEVLLKKILEQLQMLNQSVSNLEKKISIELKESKKARSRLPTTLNESSQQKSKRLDPQSTIEKILKQPLDNIFKKDCQK